MSQQPPDGANAVAGLEQVGGEAVARGMGGGAPATSGFSSTPTWPGSTASRLAALQGWEGLLRAVEMVPLVLLARGFSVAHQACSILRAR